MGPPAETEKTVSLPLRDHYRVYEVSKADGCQRVLTDTASTLTLTLAAGDAVLLRLQKASEDAFTIEYKLSENKQ